MIALRADRIGAAIEELSRITETDRPFTRLAFSEIYRKGRAWLEAAFADAGLIPRVDAAGNLVARREGRRPHLPPIALGSHSDTVVCGGRFDGIAGVVAALEAVRAIVENGIILEHPVEVLDFLAEEPGAYGLSCIGSRGISGGLTEEMLSRPGPDGRTLAEGIQRMGGDPARLPQHPVGRPYRAFLELHVEQAARLERSRIPIGIVTRFAGIERHRLTVTGRTDHAGTTPMEERLDALVAASEIVRLTNDLALAEGGRDGFVATIGQLQVRPGAANAVPGEVELTVEARSLSEVDVAAFVDRLLARGDATLKPRGFGLAIEAVSHVEPVLCSAEIQDLLVRATERRRLPYLRLPSGAGHDAMHMTRICPSGMVFVPSRKGRSHCPEEYTSAEDVCLGAEVLLEAVLLADSPSVGP